MNDSFGTPGFPSCCRFREGLAGCRGKERGKRLNMESADKELSAPL